MNDSEVERIADESADRAIRKLFLTVGIDVTDPKEVIAFQDDLRHVRVWREATEAAKRHTMKALITALVAGSVGYVALFFKWPHQ